MHSRGEFLVGECAVVLKLIQDAAIEFVQFDRMGRLFLHFYFINVDILKIYLITFV